MATTDTIPIPLLERAAQQMNGNSRRTVIIELIGNMVFVLVAIVVLVLSRRESPQVPLRLWLILYGVECVVNMFCAFLDFRVQRGLSSFSPRIIKIANLLFSIIWWAIGFYWVLSHRTRLSQDAPKLFWLTVIFLALDVFVAAIRCTICMGVCCCVPLFMIASLYLFSNQENAGAGSNVTPMTKYKFKTQPSGGIMVECDTDTPRERALSAEDITCAICHSEYENESELYELPCQHHFHCACIDNWLQSTSHCPLCKYDMSNDGNQITDQV